MNLAKPALDVGLFTNDRDRVLDFWQRRIGLPSVELLPVGGGVHQHRHAVGDSILKINHARDPLKAAPPTGLQGITVLLPGAEPCEWCCDPDGNRVRVEESGGEGARLKLHLVVNDPVRSAAFYGGTLGLAPSGKQAFRCGSSEIELIEGQVVADPVQRAKGYRYMTFQVFDVVAEHRYIVSHGGSEGLAPVKLGDVAHISFVRDPDGNWIEISQRKSITGTLD